MKCVSYTRTLPWKNHQSELTIAEQNQRIAAYLAEHKELDLLKKYSDRRNDEKARTAFDQMPDDGVAKAHGLPPTCRVNNRQPPVQQRRPRL